MAKPPEQMVYLLCRGIFTDTHTRIRQPKVIQKRLWSCKDRLQPLLSDYSLEAVVVVAKLLLEKRIFESPLLAREAFPALFAAPNAERQALEVETTRLEIAAVESAIFEEERESNAITEANAVEDTTPGPGPNGTGMTLIPSLYPVYLPSKTQHQILTKTQCILEECCFQFATTSLPEAMSARGWEYSEAAELTKWIKLLQTHKEDILPSAVSMIPGRTWQEVLNATSRIQHSAVHRLHTSAKGIQNMIGDAHLLTTMLKDTTRASLLERVSQELASSIEEVEGRLVILEKDLSEKLDLLAKRRAELDRLQDEAIHRIIHHNRENRRVIGLALGEGLKDLCSVNQTRSEKHFLSADGMKAELSEEITSAIGNPAKMMLDLDFGGESKRANGINQTAKKS